MAQIGQFTRSKSSKSGRVQTLSLDAELVLVPAERSDAGPRQPVPVDDDKSVWILNWNRPPKRDERD